jgi:tRNA modification GTPase
VDTAGLRDSVDTIEAIGIARAKKRAEHADIVLALFDASREEDADTLAHIDGKTIVVYTKADLSPAKKDVLAISTTTGENIDQLVKAMTDKIKTLTTRKDNAPLLTRARHREHVAETREHLHRAVQNNSPELKTEDIRLAARALGKLTGRVDVEDLLDVIFSEFCIGK